MDNLAEQIRAAQSGDMDAFGEIVKQFQHMAYGCAYAVLSDYHLAEDAAQEAFLDAYGKLGNLQEANAFPGWLRRIVLTRCARMTRRKRVATAPLSEAVGVLGRTDPPDREMERKERRDEVLAAVRSLPEAQRLTVTLFYIGGHSQAAVADFLEVPISTVKKRLHDSRRKLKERMVDMVGEALKQNAPVPDEKAEQVRFLLSMAEQFEEGVPVIAALDKLKGEIRSEHLATAVGQILAGIRAGGTISSTLADCAGLFPPTVVFLLRDGERCGALEEAARMAGQWLRTGMYRADRDFYRGARSPVGRILGKAVETRAREAILDPTEARVHTPGPGSPAFRPMFVLSDGARQGYDTLMLEKQMPGMEEDLKRHTVLDTEQVGDELKGTVRMPHTLGEGDFVCRVAYRPVRGGTVIQLTLG